MGFKALLVYPEMPPTYWSLKYALPFIGKKALFPPLGLLTVAAMLPPDCEVELVDMNVRPLTEEAIARADVVFTSSMIVQKDSLERVVQLCKRLGKTVVAGGPYPTSMNAQIPGVDHFILGEAETTLARFLEDFAAGRARPIYQDSGKPDIGLTPPPRFDLINLRQYATMSLQYSRGCPHNCEFCDIIEMFGRKPRTKSPEQFLAEMEALYQHGWRGSVFVVDDNFIGNRREVKELLPKIAAWQKARRYPFGLFTEATVSLAEDDSLMDLMVEAGFNMVFLGIETPDRCTLEATGKTQNLKSDLLSSVRKIQGRGMEVSGGFILGFDDDPEDIFDRQVQFIQEAGIPTAMVGLLTALPNTQLFRRLQSEGRIREDSGGNNTHDLRLNFVPKMEQGKLLSGYTRVISQIYKPDRYFERCLKLLRNTRKHRTSVRRVRVTELRAFTLSLVRQSFSSYSWSYWKFLIRGFFSRPTMTAETVTMAVKGHHFFKMTKRVMEVDRFKKYLESLTASFRARAAAVSQASPQASLEDLRAYRDEVMGRLRSKYRRIHKDFRIYAEEAVANFKATMDERISALAARASGLSPTSE
jgi:radical SAM superfamily enzyme YgiQ (UPF0313 family)